MSFLIIDQVGYEQESKTLFRNFNTPPDSARKRTINNLIKRLKSDGNWNLCDVIWLLAAHDQQASRLNWKSPGTYTFTEVNSPTWTINQGYTSNGTTSYLDTNFNPATQGVNFVAGNCSFGIYSRTNASDSGNDMGFANATIITQLLSRFTDDLLYARVNNTTTQGVSSISNTNSSGLISAGRTDSSNILSYRNGVLLDTDAVAESSVPSLNLFICCRNANGTATAFTTREYACAYAGSGAINQLKLYNAVQTYMTDLGKQI